MSVPVAIVVVAHSANLATGVVEVAAQMAPEVMILPAGGTDEDGIGTSYHRVKTMVDRACAAGHEVVVLCDLGSALMVAESVAEEYDGGVQVVDAPFLEGAVAAAVAAQGSQDLSGVARAARSAIGSFPDEHADGQDKAAGTHGWDDGPWVSRTLTLSNKLGLHARPAAIIARIVSDHDATVTVNGVDGASVLALMGLALPTGARVELRARGAQAEEVMKALVPQFEEGFGEE